MASPTIRRDRPCDACRRRKTRCNPTTNVNVCILCQSRDQECTFVHDPPRKKRRVERQASIPDAIVHPSASINQDHQIIPTKDYNSIPGPSLLKGTLGHQNRQCTSFLGLTQPLDTQLLEFAQFNDFDEDINQLGRFRRLEGGNSSSQTYFTINSDTQSDVALELSNLDAIEAVVMPHGSALVSLYFRIVHPSFPVLHKRVFLEKHGRSYRELTPLGLIAVYILSLNWWSYSLELASFEKPDIMKLENMVPSLLAECYRRPKISDLQAGLVLSQLQEHESWTLTSQLLAMAQNLGIHEDCSSWRIPDWERGVRKRVAWALFAQDKWSALLYGRPSHITDNNWDVNSLQIEDFPETAMDDDDGEGSAEVEKGRLIFTNLILLTEILADVLDVFFSLKASKMTRNLQSEFEKAKPLQIRLKTWYASLPPDLSMDEMKARKLSSTGYLHLAYFALEVTLHKAILRSVGGSTDVHLVAIARAAAVMRLSSAVEFLRRLKPHHLQSFWHFTSRMNLALVGTFGNILFATSVSIEESRNCKSQLEEFLWTLRVNSNGARFVKYAVDFLDGVMAFTNSKSLPPYNSRRRTADGPDEDTLVVSETDQSQGNAYGKFSDIHPNILSVQDFEWGDPSYQGQVSQSIAHSWYQELDINLNSSDF